MTSCRFPPPWSVKEAELQADWSDGASSSTVARTYEVPHRSPNCDSLVMLTLLFLGGQAKAKSLGELKVDCEELENFWRLYPPTKDSTLIPGQAGAAIRFGYMDAIIIGLGGSIGILSAPDPNCAVTPEGKVVGGPLCGHTLGICLPKGSSYSQVLAVFLAHARSHPAQWHEDAAPQFQLR